MKIKKIFFLICIALIIATGGYLRLVNLENNPNGLYVDEAATGYNAWSILLTGADEYGKKFPILMRFFGSYTPPLYTYLTAIPINFLGLSITSVRLISAISGIALILIFYLFLQSLDLIKERTILIATLLFATAPWAIFYSRIGYEINLAFFCYSLGILFFWYSLKKSTKFFILATFFFALTTYTYHTERLLSPLTILLSLIIFKNDLLKKKNLKLIIWGIMIYIIVLLPQFLIFLTPASISRGAGLFYYQAIINQSEMVNLPEFFTIPIFFIKEFLAQFLSYLNPRNLFFQPDADLQRSLPDLSVFYWWMVVPYLIGIWTLIKIKNSLIKKFLLMILLTSPIPAALTKDPFSTQRALPLLLPTMVIIALGLERILSYKLKLGIVTLIILTSFSLLLLYRSMATLLPNERAVVWGYGFKHLAEKINQNPHQEFLIDTSRIKPAYIELAFFLRYHPSKLQQVVDQSIKDDYYNKILWSSHYKFANLETRTINWEEDIYKDLILVGDELAVSELQVSEHHLTKIFTITGPTNEIIFQGFQTNPELKCQSSPLDYHCYNFSI